MITATIMGGLGNQLFIIFTTLAYALQTKNTVLFHYTFHLTNGCTPRNTFWDSLLLELKPLTTDQPCPNHFPIFKEKNHDYSPIISNKINTKLIGYFQSYKYFQEEYGEIARMIGLDDFQENYLRIVHGCELFTKNKQTISMHFRLGDYKYINKGTNVLPVQYYVNSLAHITSEFPNNLFTVIYFCEDEDLNKVVNNISILQSQFPMCDFLYINQTETNFCDWEQMVIMSICDHNIIANSTFSWWGAYMNKSPNNIVCYPSQKTDSKDLYLPRWTNIPFLK
jgi:hypothetical protein